MFKKLVGNLPFNPSLLSHLRDYDLRLKKELKIRLASVAFVSLILIVQLIVVFSGPNPSTYSPNNLVYNANDSLDTLSKDCNNNLDSYKNILSHYGINCSSLSSTKTKKIALNIADNNLFSLNKLSYDLTNETQLNISGKTLYVRPLSYGNKLRSKQIPTLVINASSKVFYISLASGNIISNKAVLVNNFVQQNCSINYLSSCFKYSLASSVVNSSITDANNTTQPSKASIIYTLSVSNKSKYKISKFSFSINLQNALAYSNLLNTYGGKNINGSVAYSLSSIMPFQTQTEIITLKIKSPIPNHSTSLSDPNFYAQKMIVSFGNSVTINVPKSFNKFYELNINNYLPSSSSKVSLVILAILLLVTVYLLLRTIVLIEEIKIIRHSHSNHKEMKE